MAATLFVVTQKREKSKKIGTTIMTLDQLWSPAVATQRRIVVRNDN